MISSISIIDSRGSVLIHRTYRIDGAITQEDVVQHFHREVMDAADSGSQAPVFEVPALGSHFCYIPVGDVYLVAVVTLNANCAYIFEVLRHLERVFVEYFDRVESESIKDNFVVIYELLDEVLDNGCCQVTEPSVLKGYISQESHKLVHKAAPIAVTGAVSWRSDGIHYKTNEVFLDVTERLTMLVSSTGEVLRSGISGTVHLNAKLSGMPEIKMGFNERAPLDGGETRFHPCVRDTDAATGRDRAFSFVPPDGDFNLLTYSSSRPVKPLVAVSVINTHPKSTSAVHNVIKLRALYSRGRVAQNVKVSVPMPSDIDTPRFPRCPLGTMTFDSTANAVVWTISELAGQTELIAETIVGLPSIADPIETARAANLPVSVHLTVPSFTVSGMRVRYLKVMEKAGYGTTTWVKYTSETGFEVRRG